MSANSYRRLAVSDAPAEQTEADTFRFVFSDESVGRDGHRVFNAGIRTENYLRNPIVLWAHDNLQPPIGAGRSIDTSGLKCRINVQFVPREISAFAGMVRDLVAGKWLRALSMSWRPLEWHYATEVGRPNGGIDFTKVDLLEISVVPLPALPDALLDARSNGVNTAPLRLWAECALDRSDAVQIPKPQLEAIYRAAKMPSRSTREGRIARLREIQREARIARLREIQRD